MSWTTEVTIWCDGVGCVNWAAGEGGLTLAETRAALRRIGWRRVTVRGTRFRADLCPDCMAARVAAVNPDAAE